MRFVTWLSSYSFLLRLVKCGHGAFSDHAIVNNILGFVTHSFLWTPYFSWKISHHRHHSNHASMERDEVYVPKTREDLGIPDEVEGSTIDYEELLGDTPIYTLFMLIRQQVLAFPAYLRESNLTLLRGMSNLKHSLKSSTCLAKRLTPNGPIISIVSLSPCTSHQMKSDCKYLANSILFTRAQRNAVIMSNIGIAAMVWGVSYACSVYGAAEVIKYYAIPWLEVSHWCTLIFLSLVSTGLKAVL